MAAKTLIHLLTYILSITAFTDALTVTSGDRSFGLNNFIPDIKTEADPSSLTQAKPISLRIRSTREDDVGEISTLLATASIGADGPSLNWKQRIDMLRVKRFLQSLLEQRFHVLRIGREAATAIDQNTECVISDADRLRLVWEHANFAVQLEKASKMSSEPHVWKQHNFALCPPDAVHLQHIMMTAMDSTTGTIVGFCEVAMMTPPDSVEKDNNKVTRLPTIANLVTNTQYRRQGIATSLLKSATRFVRDRWESDEIGLYVYKDNQRAASLYQKLGFEAVCSAGDKNDKLFMSLRSTAKRKETTEKVKERELVLS
eukprot:CAMPEP_0202465148 /NCGR_PEP_ID=MMETSP1360-20130828/64551_1 /ASSEMBLY_ACC=CAM_ASM_000848 /TAXON_ID=515479 /ORGANISM="Licmophora paradoxa, Strain CCMP2313" /LENGTH=314 /DNA_ID=CAMNT_0049088761 /DNA_START=1 /DNA_END=945 /DNA_ORIENTATION=+